MPLCFFYPYSVHCFINNSYEEEDVPLDSGDHGIYLSQLDPEVGASIREEFARERRNIELIASENIVSPGRYAGHGHLPDQQICRRLSRQAVLRRLLRRGRHRRDRPEAGLSALRLQLHANVQPHSGANANLAAFFALASPATPFWA